MKVLVSSVLLFLGLSGLGLAAEAGGSLRVEVQIVAVPQAAAIPLIKDFGDPAKVDAAAKQIDDLLVRGEGKLIGWPVTIVTGEQTSYVRAVQELPVAVSYEPPAEAKVKPADKAAPTLFSPQVSGVLKFKGVPTSFKEQQVGVELEVQGQFSDDGKSILLSVSLTRSWLKGQQRIELRSVSAGETTEVEQPVIGTNTVRSRFTAAPGRPMLIGSFATEEPSKQIELFILKADKAPLE